MTRYSITRRRHIKKYKKSRKGCGGRGRRSVRSGKTRKPKGFRKAKRHTVGKRMKMYGGFNFEVNEQEIKAHILSKYSQQLKSNGIEIDSNLNLAIMGKGDVQISKDALFAKNFRPEQVVVVKLGGYTGLGQNLIDGQWYALVRCANMGEDSSCRESKGIEENTVLFVKYGTRPKNVEFISYRLRDRNTDPVIKKRKDKKYPTDSDVTAYFDRYRWFTFKNSISSTDNYNIFVDSNCAEKSLLYFFYRIAEADVFRKEDTVLTLYNDGDYLSALDEMNQDHLTREQAHQQ
jgi:hypothetical protein